MNWQTSNQAYLTLALQEIRDFLQQYLQLLPNVPENLLEQSLPTFSTAELEAISLLNPPPALETLIHAFSLTSFERRILLLCAGVELSASLAQICAYIQGNPQFIYPTLSLVLAVFPDAQWDAFTPVSALRRGRLIEVESLGNISQSRLRIDERVLYYLLGIFYLDPRLASSFEAITQNTPLAPSHHAICDRIREQWTMAWTTIQLMGDDLDSNLAITATTCATLGIQLYRLKAEDIPLNREEKNTLRHLWEREAKLTHAALLVEGEEFCDRDRMRSILSFCGEVNSLLILSSREPFALHRRPVLQIRVNQLNFSEQRLLWQSMIGSTPQLNSHLDRLISQFNLNGSAIQAITAIIQPNSPENSILDLNLDLLWENCRAIARPRLDDLAQRIDVRATWEDLILPAPQYQLLQDLVAQVRQRFTVYEKWEFAATKSQGLGITALFAGISGTGKTMAAEVLAQALQLDLYRIDLSQMVSKYIGETEKNLSRVFAAAEKGGAILLFDEADALFGKRSEVKDSHDRYANIEVSYLLQRMEAYRGLAILTTNLKSVIDTAFLRRIRMIIHFPFPDYEQRLAIWQRMFPPKMPTLGLDFYQLARLNVPGGNIRNIVLNAAFLAADEDQPLQMTHLLRSAHSEYHKLEKQLTDSEIGGWVTKEI